MYSADVVYGIGTRTACVRNAIASHRMRISFVMKVLGDGRMRSSPSGSIPMAEEKLADGGCVRDDVVVLPLHHDGRGHHRRRPARRSRGEPSFGAARRGASGAARSLLPSPRPPHPRRRASRSSRAAGRRGRSSRPRAASPPPASRISGSQDDAFGLQEIADAGTHRSNGLGVPLVDDQRHGLLDGHTSRTPRGEHGAREDRVPHRLAGRSRRTRFGRTWHLFPFVEEGPEAALAGTEAFSRLGDRRYQTLRPSRQT